MTSNKTFKHRVRARMAKTGESYTAARRILIAAGDTPPAAPELGPGLPISEQRVHQATGRGWQEWLQLLEQWPASGKTHTQIARWLVDEHHVDHWYAQSITLGYERVIRGRAVGQQPDGFAVSVTRTISVPVEELFQAFDDDNRRARLLPNVQMQRRSATTPKAARYDWEDGETRIFLTFDARDSDKSRVTLSHERLPDAETADEMKLWWRTQLDALKRALEAGPQTAD